ncbi:MAG: hypothetical protein IKY38_02305, partial [Anaerotignum sp.]|nr:hypothetical protein [Anaerotignum sp.]
HRDTKEVHRSTKSIIKELTSVKITFRNLTLVAVLSFSLSFVTGMSAVMMHEAQTIAEITAAADMDHSDFS